MMAAIWSQNCATSGMAPRDSLPRMSPIAWIASGTAGQGVAPGAHLSFDRQTATAPCPHDDGKHQFGTSTGAGQYALSVSQIATQGTLVGAGAAGLTASR